MDRNKTAFTLVELILVVLFLSIVAVIAVPRLSYSGSSGQKADGVAEKIVTDLRRTRMLAISNAATNPAGFTLKITITRLYHGYQIIDDSSGTAVDSQTLDRSVLFIGDSQFSFEPLGNLRKGSGTVLQILTETGNRFYKISITNATGMVKCDRLS